jgi:putative ABC transport system permease protein
VLVRCYRVLAALLLPRPFHEEYGEELAESLRSRLSAAPRRVARLLLFAFEIADLLRTAALERIRADRVEGGAVIRRVSSAIRQDVRHTLRSLRRTPGFTAVVALTIALGVGANAAVFNVIDQLMFRPYPYLHDASRVDRVYLQFSGRDRRFTNAVFPYTRYLDFDRWTRSFAGTAAFTLATVGVGTGDAATQRAILGVSGSFFSLFDARPVVGRFLGADDDHVPTGSDVAVLSYAFWSAAYGQRDVLGTSIQVGNAAYVIVGVAPRGFVGVAEGIAPSVFVPITAYATNEGGGNGSDYYLKYSWDWTQMMVRRKPGVSEAAASADLSAAFVRSWKASRLVHPLYRSAEEVRPSAIAGPMKTAAGPDRSLEARTLLWVGAVALLVLMIACANVASLSLARGVRRRREVAVCRALGVGRGRLAAQALTESTVLALLGGAMGVAMAQWGGAALRDLFTSRIRGIDVVTDWRTLTMAVGVALAIAVATGLVPALTQGGDDLTLALKTGVRSGGRRRSAVLGALLVIQAALSVVLLVGAGLFVRSLLKARDQPLGYEVQPVLLARWERRGTPMDSVARADLRARMLETALARPDVMRGGWTNSAPFDDGTSTLLLGVPGIDAVSRLGRFTYQVVSADYFHTVDTHIVRGRGFTDADRVDAPPVVVVSEAMAATLWPGQEPLGKCLRYAWQGDVDTAPCATVVGVAENAVYDPASDLPLRYYIPDTQLDFGATWLLLRMSDDPATAAEDVRRTLQAVMPGLAEVTVEPAQDMVLAKRRSWRVGATMFVALGSLALLVAGMGLFAIVAFHVEQRRHELGVRVALGARGPDVLRIVVRQALGPAGGGIVAGSVVSLLGARWVQPLLYEQSARDPTVFGGVGLVLIMVALIASAVPAARALRTDPNHVLQAE